MHLYSIGNHLPRRGGVVADCYMCCVDKDILTDVLKLFVITIMQLLLFYLPSMLPF